jgi:hypothetical protein
LDPETFLADAGVKPAVIPSQRSRSSTNVPQAVQRNTASVGDGDGTEGGLVGEAEIIEMLGGPIEGVPEGIEDGDALWDGNLDGRRDRLEF